MPGQGPILITVEVCMLSPATLHSHPPGLCPCSSKLHATWTSVQTLRHTRSLGFWVLAWRLLNLSPTNTCTLTRPSHQTHTVTRVHTQHTHTHTLISLSVTHTLSLCLSLSLCASLCLSPSGSQEPAAVSVTGSVLSFITVVCSVSLSLTLSVCLSLSLP